MRRNWPIAIIVAFTVAAAWQYYGRLLPRRERPLHQATVGGGLESLAERFPPPAGYRRVPVPLDSWGAWLRLLPLRPRGTDIVNQAGRTIVPGTAPTLGAVLAIDVRRDQQCADIIYRLRAEYLWTKGRADEVSFKATDGSTLGWRDWRRGIRPFSLGKRLAFGKTAPADNSRAAFDTFLAAIFRWCGTISLRRDTVSVGAEDLQVGDILVKAGSPGHAVLIVDLVQDRQGNRKALIMQGWMPAQSPHIVSPRGGRGWVGLQPGRRITVPRFGSFDWDDLRRFAPSPATTSSP